MRLESSSTTKKQNMAPYSRNVQSTRSKKIKIEGDTKRIYFSDIKGIIHYESIPP